MSGKISWIIAAILLVGFLGFLGFKLFVPQADGPTPATAKPGVLEKHRPEMSITEIMNVDIDNDNAAGQYYAQAIEKFKEKQSDFEEMYKNFTESDGSSEPELYEWQLELVDQLRNAMAPAKSCGKMEYIFVQTPKEMKLTAIVDEQEGLTWLGNILACLSMHYELQKDWKNALAAAQDMLVLGWQMTNDDSRVKMEMDGLELQAEAAKLMSQYYDKLGKKEMSQRCEEYNQQVMIVLNECQQKFGNVWNLRKRNDNKQGPYPGDLFNIIENDKTRAWKVEALLAMSIAKVQEQKHKGNTKKINELLDKASKSDDALMVKAAELTKNASKEDVENALRGG